MKHDDESSQNDSLLLTAPSHHLFQQTASGIAPYARGSRSEQLGHALQETQYHGLEVAQGGGRSNGSDIGQVESAHHSPALFPKKELRRMLKESGADRRPLRSRGGGCASAATDAHARGEGHAT